MLVREQDTRALMSEAKFYESYSRWDDGLDRYETWDESVSRVMTMHRETYGSKMTDQLKLLINEAESSYKLQRVLGAQRALQFGGDQLLKHQMRMYNCTSSYADRASFFGELFYILLCGAGAGFSVQKHHVDKLPDIQQRKGQAKIHTIGDDIEGWGTAVDVMLSSFFVGGGKHPEYEGRRVHFEYHNIRKKNSYISGGFKAPGPDPLRKALDLIEYLLQGLVLKGVTKLLPIHVYDIAMFIADAVLAGGVRRSATICLFSLDDQEMMSAKTGNWFEDNPQRGRSNNSAVVIRDQVTREQFSRLFNKTRTNGEPGFYFVTSTEHSTNPCVEIGMFPQLDGVTGWQGCNLTEINGSLCTSEEAFYQSCRAAAILGTLQAGYTDFKFLPDSSREIFEREALLGVSVTGWMNNPDVLFDVDVMRHGAKIVREVNREVAELIGINPAARTTCVKPSGNASVLLKTASGIHPEHSPRYLRAVEMNKESEVAQMLKETNPYMVEDSVWSTNNTDYKISFPVINQDGALYKRDNYGVDFLERVRSVQEAWVEAGTDVSLCVDPTVRHNVSNTVTVKEDQWEEVEEFLFENKDRFSGVSFLPASGDLDYHQAPFTEVLTAEGIVERYGNASIFAAGLVVDVYKGFSDLWTGIKVAIKNPEGRGELSDLRADWIRRYKKFAENYFDGDLKETEYCLKDVFLLHKWSKIQQNLEPIDFVNGLTTKKYIDVDTMGSQACIGGACEI